MTAWTPEENDKLRALLARGVGWAAIPRLMGRSRHACRRHAARIGAKMDVADQRRRHSEGVSATWTPERRAAQSERVKHRQWWNDGHRAIAADETVKDRRRTKQIATRAKWWDWCPLEYRKAYRAAANVLGAKAARADFERIIAQDKAAKLAALSPFERMLERARCGEVQLLDLDVIQPRRVPLAERDQVSA